MKIFFLAVLLFFFSSCTKDGVTLSYTNFINSTNHSINVRAYLGGLIQNQSSFILNPNETKQVFDLNNRGVGNGVSFGVYSHPLDSFVVTFDNTYNISHYKPTLIGMSIKKYLYSSKRNIYNDSSYIPNLLKDTKYRREWDFKYTFVEQDYLDAK